MRVADPALLFLPGKVTVMDATLSSRSRRRPPRLCRSLLLCVLSLVVCGAVAGFAVAYRQDLEQRTMERLLEEKSGLIVNIVTRLMHKTEALRALVVRSNGEMEAFESIAPIIADDPSIHNILIAPDGVVSHVYPLSGNERLIGFDLFGRGNGNKEALLARQKRDFVLGGPFVLMEGGRGIAGRLPVFLGRSAGKTRFWGIVSVTLRYPEALHEARLHDLEHDGFGYEIWRINPDDGRRQSIAASADTGGNDGRGLERPIRMHHAEWLFRIVPARSWYERPDNWLLFFLALCISALVWVVARNDEKLVRVKHDLACLLDKDALTGTLNRTGLFRVMKALVDKGAPFVLYYFDLNHFKHINDTYGHNVGDRVLTTFCRRLEKHLGPDHALARMSGDEFILVHAPDALCDEDERRFWEHVDYEFSRPISGDQGEAFTLSFSTGKAVYPEDGNGIDALIHQADLRMYEEKRIQYAGDLKRRYSDGP